MVTSGHTRRRRRVRVAVSIAAVSTFAVMSAASASAATTSDPNWWYSAYGVGQVHADGITGSGVKVAVIDAQINPDLPDFQGADLTVYPEAACEGASPTDAQPTDDAVHGSTITAMLIGNGSGAGNIQGIAPGASVTFYGRGPVGTECTPNAAASSAELSATGWLIKQALDDGADIITTSIGGGSSEQADEGVIAEAIARKVPIVSAIPNDASEGGPTPWSYRGVIATNGVDSDRQLLRDSLGSPNVGVEVSVLAPGGGLATLGTSQGWDTTRVTNGASFAAPLVAGILAAAKEKYPDATGNQLVQSLLHNTGSDDHELQYDDRDGYAYGIASLGHILREDPAQYPDENLLLNKSFELPTDEEVSAAMEKLGPSSPAPSTTDAGGDSSENPSSSAIAVPFIIGGVIVIVIIAAVILTIILVRRSNRTHRRGQS